MMKNNAWLNSIIELLKYNWWAFVIIMIGFFVAYHFVTPPPPREITIATGSEQGGYHRFGLQLKTALERKGLRVNLRPSAGTIENFKLLSDADSSVSVAFAQGGAERFYEGAKEGIHGLGSLFYEPLWIFYRKDANMNAFADLARMKVAIGRDGSGTQMLSKVMLRENNVPESAWVSIGFAEAIPALKKNEIQAMFFVAPVNDPWDTHKPNPNLYTLMADPELSLFPVKHAQAYISRLPHLATVTIGEGLIDLEKDFPPAAITLMSPMATLICRDDLNGDIAVLILQTCRELREHSGWLEKAGEFPAKQGVTFPLLPEAEQFYEKGPSFFYKFLPFWVANMANRLWIMAIPLVTLAIPLLKLVLPTYRWRIRRKIATKYRLLMEIDERIAKGNVTNTLDADIAQLIQYEDELTRLSVPIMFAGDYYSLRIHVRYLRGRLEEIRGKSPLR
ncbi:putative TRAP-type uncharacterized transport system, substrate-binding protein [Gammaproteobacteria bacterium]